MPLYTQAIPCTHLVHAKPTKIDPQHGCAPSGTLGRLVFAATASNRCQVLSGNKSLDLALDLHELHLEDQASFARDRAAGCAVVSVCKVRVNVKLPLVPLMHKLHRLCPTLDDLIGCEAQRFAPIVRGIELRPVDELALVMAVAWG